MREYLNGSRTIMKESRWFLCLLFVFFRWEAFRCYSISVSSATFEWMKRYLLQNRHWSSLCLYFCRFTPADETKFHWPTPERDRELQKSVDSFHLIFLISICINAMLSNSFIILYHLISIFSLSSHLENSRWINKQFRVENRRLCNLFEIIISMKCCGIRCVLLIDTDRAFICLNESRLFLCDRWRCFSRTRILMIVSCSLWMLIA